MAGINIQVHVLSSIVAPSCRPPAAMILATLYSAIVLPGIGHVVLARNHDHDQKVQANYKEYSEHALFYNKSNLQFGF